MDVWPAIEASDSAVWPCRHTATRVAMRMMAITVKMIMAMVPMTMRLMIALMTRKQEHTHNFNSNNYFWDDSQVIAGQVLLLQEGSS